MYERSASVYDELYADRRDYATDAARLRDSIRMRKPEAASLLDVACGTGRHLEILRSDFDVVGVDTSPAMLRIARERLPGLELVEADMAEFDLARRFDAVTYLFSSIGYVRTESGLRRAIVNFARHLSAGGVLIVEPWLEPPVFEDGRVSLGVLSDEPHRKIARMIVSRRDGNLSRLEFRLLIGTAGGIEEIAETHELGLFTQAQTRDAFDRAGLDVEHDPEGLMGRGLYIGVKRP
jgi:SAM-dependent methyltransferase